MKNGKRFLKSLFLLTAAFVMLMCVPTMAQVTKTMKYKDGFYQAGYTAQKNENIYFKLKVTKYGLVDVLGSEISPYGSVYGTRITLVNASHKRRDYYSSVYVNAKSGSVTYSRYAVSPGTYYFRIKMSKGYTYKLFADYKCTSNNSGGSSKSKAVTLSKGKAVTGVISAASLKGAKWFKFYVPQQGKPVSLKLQVNGGQGEITFYLAGPNFKSTQKNTIYPNATQSKSRAITMWQENVYTKVKTGPKAGWYYLLVTKNSNNSYKRSNGQFAVKWSY